MKFYISAKWQLKDKVKEIQDYLIQKGHKIPVDWTERAFERNYEEYSSSSEHAKEEIESILCCDVLIHLSEQSGKGKYTDLGAGITGKILKGKPEIYVLGDPANESQFYFHPFVKRLVETNHLKGIEKILVDLKN